MTYSAASDRADAPVVLVTGATGALGRVAIRRFAREALRDVAVPSEGGRKLGGLARLRSRVPGDCKSERPEDDLRVPVRPVAHHHQHDDDDDQGDEPPDGAFGQHQSEG